MRRRSPVSVNLSMTYHGRRAPALHLRGGAHFAGKDRGGVLLQLAGLADDPGEDRRRDGPRFHEIPKEVSRTHWRQLVVIAHQNHGGLLTVDGLKQPPGERDIHHGYFVDHQDVRLDRDSGRRGNRCGR